MMICHSDIVDCGQGLAYGEEVDVSVRQTELPIKRTGGAVKADQVLTSRPQARLGSRAGSLHHRTRFRNPGWRLRCACHRHRHQ